MSKADEPNHLGVCDSIGNPLIGINLNNDYTIVKVDTEGAVLFHGLDDVMKFMSKFPLGVSLNFIHQFDGEKVEICIRKKT